jgi:hypothetical protein
MRKLISAVASAALVAALAGPALAAGKKSGFDTIATQGQSGHLAKPGATNQGIRTTTGPHGQVKQGKTTNVTTTGPGNSTKMP